MIPQTVTNGAAHSYTEPVERTLAAVEDLLAQEMESSVATATMVSQHILQAGGKRLRPTLVTLSAYACAPDVDPVELRNIAASAEIVHMATLMHDDVIDNADSRRGRVTANYRWGNQLSVLTGDYMLAKAFTLLAGSGDIRVIQAISGATTAMTEGEILQIECTGNPEADEETYLTIIRGKTAAFMSTCCRLGAIIAGAPTAVEAALADFGMSLGMAFQVTDDILDLVGDPLLIGKPVGGDIREGKITLPLILTRRAAGAGDVAEFDRIVTRGEDVTPEEIDFIRSLAESTGAVELSLDAARGFVNEGLRDLRALPESEERAALETLAQSVLGRDR